MRHLHMLNIIGVLMEIMQHMMEARANCYMLIANRTIEVPIVTSDIAYYIHQYGHVRMATSSAWRVDCGAGGHACACCTLEIGLNIVQLYTLNQQAHSPGMMMLYPQGYWWRRPVLVCLGHR